MGQGYDVLKPSISILIADYKVEQLKHISKYHTIWNLREKDFLDEIISNNIELHVLEIPKIKDGEMLKDELAQWLKFIENPGNKEVEKLMGENIFLKQAKEELAYLSGDPDFQLLVESRAGMLKDIYYFKKEAAKRGQAEGHAKGLEQGIKNSKIDIAKKLLKIKMPIEQISEITELSKEEIEKIKKNKTV